jgi:hypothetical protein
MAFVTEYIPVDDICKYGIEEINKFFHKAQYQPSWTVDRERDIYLRYLNSGREEKSQERDFSYFWKGHPLFVRLFVEGGGKRGGEGWSSYSHLRMGLPENYYLLNGVCLPSPLCVQEAEIVADLKEALIAFKDFGVFSATTSHRAIFGF